MTGLTSIAGRNVRRRLRRRMTTSVGARPKHLQVIKTNIGFEPTGGRCMTCITYAGRCHMGVGFAAGGCTVMATRAGAGCLRMINFHHLPIGVRLVALFTQITRRHMGTALAARNRSVVATETTAGIDPRVIERSRRPCADTVAVAACLRRREMVCALAARSRTVMTAFACAQYLGVIDRRIRDIPVGADCVAGVAYIRCRDVAATFPARRGAVVAIEANLVTDLRHSVCE